MLFIFIYSRCESRVTGVKNFVLKGLKKKISFNVFTLESATYAVPGGILSISNRNTAFCKVWPWALHIVAYAAEKG